MIAVGLPKSAQQNCIDKLPKSMRAWPAHYQGLSSEMSDFSVVIVGTSMCSCDLFNQGSTENLFERYRKKGWSKSKIQRAIENQKKSNRHSGLDPELRRWLADAATNAGEAFVFIHWDTNELKYEQRIQMSVDEMREQTIQIKDEQLIHLKNKGISFQYKMVYSNS